MNCVYQKIYPAFATYAQSPSITSSPKKSIITLIKNISDMRQVIESILIDIHSINNIIADKTKEEMANLNAPLGLYLITESDGSIILYHKNRTPYTSYMSYFANRYETLVYAKWTALPLSIPVHCEIVEEDEMIKESDLQKIE